MEKIVNAILAGILIFAIGTFLIYVSEFIPILGDALKIVGIVYIVFVLSMPILFKFNILK